MNDATDARFANLELGDPTPPVILMDTKDERAAQTVTSQLPAAVTPPKEIIPGVTIDQENLRRTMADEAAARKAGFSLPPPIYELGRSVLEVGRENYQASRKEFDKMAKLTPGCAELINRINAEERRDILVDVPHLHMLDNGKLHVFNVGDLPLSNRAIEGLCFHTTPTGAKYLAECPPDLRAKNFNHWFKIGYRPDKRAAKKNAKEKAKETPETEVKPTEVYKSQQVTLRTRNAKTAEGQQTREVYACVGPRYGVFDFNQIIERVHNFLDGRGLDARVEVKYDGYGATLDVLFHSDIKPENAAVGEIFKAGLRIKTKDDGSGAITVSVTLMRNLCLNFFILGQADVLVARKTHKGKTETIEGKLQEALDGVDEKIGYFMKAWSGRSLENVIERYNLANPREVFQGLVDNDQIHIANVESEDMVARLMRAWDKEQGYSVTHFVNAITRAAHESEWGSPDDVEELEQQGTSLLFQKNWVLAAPADQTVADVLGGF